MTELLLQFIWQYSLYSPLGLRTEEGETLTVIHPGKRNTNAGPDFEEARIEIGNTIFVGNVELHINNSDWEKHKHQQDPAYKNIILHVVYNNDKVIVQPFPVLVLQKHVSTSIVDRYTSLIQADQHIPCKDNLPAVKNLIKESWLSRLLAERWEEKLQDWKELLDQTAGDWRNLLFWRMAANFGFKVNATPFLMLAKSIPLMVLTKHKGNLLQIEALLFGQSGLLADDPATEYEKQLLEEYCYLKSKYKLEPIPAHLWKFLRMRPANFPTVRIAQFAALIHKSLHLFSRIVACTSVKEIEPYLDITASEFWDRHYTFKEEQKRATKKTLGAASIQNIIINTIAPVQFLYYYYHGNASQQEQALQTLSSIPAEKDRVTDLWNTHQWKPQNAGDSQALIQLFNNYCSKKRCLECAIGLSIIKSVV